MGETTHQRAGDAEDSLTASALVPYRPDFSSLVHATQHERAFAASRREMIDEIRYIEPIRRAARDLDQTTLYKLVLRPRGAKLHTDAAGHIKGVFYKNGKIVKHARFKAVRPSFVKAIRAVGPQVLLVSVAVQLSDIRKAVEQLSLDLHNDRLAEIEAGRNQLAQAFLVENESRREHLMLHAIQSLNTGVAKVVGALRTQIGALPTTDSGLLDNWVRSKAEQAKVKMSLASESYQGALFGIQLLSESYAFLGEPKAAAGVLTNLLAAVKACGIAEAAQRARLVPHDDGTVLPERQWQSFLEAEPTLLGRLGDCEELASDRTPSLTVEVKPSELAKGD